MLKLLSLAINVTNAPALNKTIFHHRAAYLASRQCRLVTCGSLNLCILSSFQITKLSYKSYNFSTLQASNLPDCSPSVPIFCPSICTDCAIAAIVVMAFLGRSGGLRANGEAA